ncbi:MAG: hypothetical protein RIS70_3127, partial [Planctomycetota bacterium]
MFSRHPVFQPPVFQPQVCSPQVFQTQFFRQPVFLPRGLRRVSEHGGDFCRSLQSRKPIRPWSVLPDLDKLTAMTSPLDILGPNGRIAARLPRYECREQQLAMADAVSQALSAGRHLVVEAGTGVGKSFGYLVPAVLAVTSDNGPRPEGSKSRHIVISTHTISLQEQLISKDLPFLRSVMPNEFTAVLVKGRGNYLSRRRLSIAAGRAPYLFQAERDFEDLNRIVAWTKHAKDGSLSELDFRPSGQVWDEVASETGNCLGRQCSYHKDCFYFAARRRINHAQILVVNHALFFSDLALRRVNASLLPDYEAVIFDEAHSLESVAADHLGLSVTSGQIQYTLNRLYNRRTGRGLLVVLGLDSLQSQTANLADIAENFFEAIRDAMEFPADGNSGSLRVRSPLPVDDRLSPAMRGLAKQIERFASGLKQNSERQDLVAAHQRLEALAGEVATWCEQQLAHAAYWVETRPNRHGLPRVTLAASPVDVGPILAEHLFSKTRSVILTSATLSVGQNPSFDFYKTRIGLTHCDSKRLGSPFNYEQQARLILLDGMPDPSS